MAFLDSLLILFLVFVSTLVPIIIIRRRRYRNHTTTSIPTNWPVFGMIPGLLVNTHRLHEYATDFLIESRGGTFMFKGPWLANMDMLFTTDPLDIHHILSKNFSNYPKGVKYQRIFDILGDGILNSDGKLWEMNRKIIFSILKCEGFQNMLETVLWDKLENGLLPIFESFCERGAMMDLQDVFQRLAFDTVCIYLLDNDPETLSLDFPCVPVSKAFTDAEEAILLRHVTPPYAWKLQQILGVGKEKKLKDAWKLLDEFIYNILAQKQREYNNTNHHEEEDEKFIFFAAIMREFEDHISTDQTSLDPTKFLRDALVNLMAAGKDTISSALSWFFYLLATNRNVEDKILDEIQTHLEVNAHKRWNVKDLNKMVYLHGALCESLRLYPTVPFNNKSPLQPEILPSGHHVDKNTNIILSFYSMGRIKSIWGEDCMEYKPERWISNMGDIKNEASYKFATFNAGPRTCLGKSMALSQLKMVATLIIHHYHIQLVDGHRVLLGDSIVLHMKHGLQVRLKRRGVVN